MVSMMEGLHHRIERAPDERRSRWDKDLISKKLEMYRSGMQFEEEEEEERIRQEREEEERLVADEEMRAALASKLEELACREGLQKKFRDLCDSYSTWVTSQQETLQARDGFGEGLEAQEKVGKHMEEKAAEVKVKDDAKYAALVVVWEELTLMNLVKDNRYTPRQLGEMTTLHNSLQATAATCLLAYYTSLLSFFSLHFKEWAIGQVEKLDEFRKFGVTLEGVETSKKSVENIVSDVQNLSQEKSSRVTEAAERLRQLGNGGAQGSQHSTEEVLCNVDAALGEMELLKTNLQDALDRYLLAYQQGLHERVEERLHTSYTQLSGWTENEISKLQGEELGDELEAVTAFQKPMFERHDVLREMFKDKQDALRTLFHRQKEMGISRNRYFDETEEDVEKMRLSLEAAMREQVRKHLEAMRQLTQAKYVKMYRDLAEWTDAQIAEVQKSEFGSSLEDILNYRTTLDEDEDLRYAYSHAFHTGAEEVFIQTNALDATFEGYEEAKDGTEKLVVKLGEALKERRAKYEAEVLRAAEEIYGKLANEYERWAKELETVCLQNIAPSTGDEVTREIV